jgi:hypothetical protein
MSGVIPKINLTSTNFYQNSKPKKSRSKSKLVKASLGKERSRSVSSSASASRASVIYSKVKFNKGKQIANIEAVTLG